jgi:hypothetical protein
MKRDRKGDKSHTFCKPGIESKLRGMKFFFYELSTPFLKLYVSEKKIWVLSSSPFLGASLEAKKIL